MAIDIKDSIKIMWHVVLALKFLLLEIVWLRFIRKIMQMELEFIILKMEPNYLEILYKITFKGKDLNYFVMGLGKWKNIIKEI
jgi:hypothetical protein